MYRENDEKSDFPEFEKIFARFREKRILKAPEQTRIYEAISNCWCIGKTVLDAGCGLGIGTNILGRDAVGAWGVDKNEGTILAAQQLYENPRIKFAVADLAREFPRPVATFDIVVCVEVIEHVKDYEAVFANLKRFHDDKRRTIFFISSPNRNSPKLGQEQPANEYHVREWTAGEFYDILTKHFRAVVLYSAEKLSVFDDSETVDGNTTDTPLLAKCELPI
jgi:2-polyprenyl-3-methyl-5-hydroxy-6-metoxy-1,4-benzoquinol methylase